MAHPMVNNSGLIFPMAVFPVFGSNVWFDGRKLKSLQKFVSIIRKPPTKDGTKSRLAHFRQCLVDHVDELIVPGK